MIKLEDFEWGWSHNPVDAKCTFEFDMFWWIDTRQNLVDAWDIDRCKKDE